MKLAARLTKERLLLASCALAALLVRLFVLSYEYVITPDGVAYAWLGRHLASGNFRLGFSTYQQPLYPLLVGLSSLLFTDLEFAGRFVSVLAGSLLVVPVYYLASAFYEQRVAFLAACLTALFPVLIYYSTLLLTESTYTLFFATAVLVGWHALRQTRPILFFWTGLTLGACYLLRPEAFGFLFLLAALSFIAKRCHRVLTSPRTLLNVLALLAGFVLLASPYLIYLRHQTGRWMISGKMGEHFLLFTPAGEAPQLTAPAAAPPPAAATPSLIETDPPETAVSAPESGLTKFIVDATKSLRSEYEIINLIFPPLFVLLTGVGLFREKWTRGRLARELYLTSFMIAVFIGYALTIVDIRYLIPLLPLLLCWVANGIAEFEKWLIETLTEVRGQASHLRVQAWVVRATLVSLSVILLLPIFVYLNRGDKWDDYLGQKRAGQWIKAHAATTPTVMAENPISSFYAGGNYVQLPNDEYPGVITAARRQGAEFLVIYARYQINTRLKFMLDGQNIPPEIRLIYEHGEGNFKVVVYQLAAQVSGAPGSAPLD